MLVSSKNNNNFIIDDEKKMFIFKEKNDICPICYDFIFLKTYIEPCSHFFCKKCINMWYKKNKTCPYCRSNIKGLFEEKIHFLTEKKIYKKK